MSTIGEDSFAKVLGDALSAELFAESIDGGVQVVLHNDTNDAEVTITLADSTLVNESRAYASFLRVEKKFWTSAVMSLRFDEGFSHEAEESSYCSVHSRAA